MIYVEHLEDSTNYQNKYVIFFSGNGFYKYQKQTKKHEIKILSTKT